MSTDHAPITDPVLMAFAAQHADLHQRLSVKALSGANYFTAVRALLREVTDAGYTHADLDEALNRHYAIRHRRAATA